jgi:hypothetical protein
MHATAMLSSGHVAGVARPAIAVAPRFGTMSPLVQLSRLVGTARLPAARMLTARGTSSTLQRHMQVVQWFSADGFLAQVTHGVSQCASSDSR